MWVHGVPPRPCCLLAQKAARAEHAPFSLSPSRFIAHYPPTATAAMDAFATKTGRKIFERHIKQYEPKDPLYEEYVDDRGRQRRRRVRGL